jgi:C1A family cysteine protease
MTRFRGHNSCGIRGVSSGAKKGYGYLPYEFVLGGLADDWWKLIEQGWVDTGQFGEWIIVNLLIIIL